MFKVYIIVCYCSNLQYYIQFIYYFYYCILLYKLYESRNLIFLNILLDNFSKPKLLPLRTFIRYY